MSPPVLERRRMPKSQLEVMSIDWERSQAWLSVTLLPPSLWEPDPVDPQLLPGTRASWHFSKSTSWSISTISHIPVSSLVTWDCLMCARIMAGLSKNAISYALYRLACSFGCFLSVTPSCLFGRGPLSLQSLSESVKARDDDMRRVIFSISFSWLLSLLRHRKGASICVEGESS